MDTYGHAHSDAGTTMQVRYRLPNSASYVSAEFLFSVACWRAGVRGALRPPQVLRLLASSVRFGDLPDPPALENMLALMS